MSKLNFNLIKMLLIGLLMSPVITNAGVYEHPLKSLTTSEKTSLKNVSDKAKVVVVFQPDCSWCEKQIEDLTKLSPLCEKAFDTVLIGARGNRLALKRELKRYKTDFMALQGDRTFLRQLGDIRATPIVLFFDAKGEILGRKRGYIEPELLSHAVNLQTNNKCKV